MSASDNLSPVQFGEGDGTDGPLGSYGDPGSTMTQGFQGVNTIGQGNG